MTASARLRAAWNAVMAMTLFNDYSYFVLFYTLSAPALPWLLARKRGASAIWRASGLTLVFLLLFNALLWPACLAAHCGQGAIGILALWMMAVMSGVVTLAVSSELARRRR